ncbi:membrane-associated phospholipid phosphatase [Lachnospiraceae bacterium JC7]|nr:membrane-associated phospholipid phosphatase [Lachnospiraceae bacterium JC7]
MDIDILLILQSFREGAGACLTDFLSKMTWYGEMNIVLIIMGLIYWCVNKDIGTYLLMGWSGNRIVNGVLKVSVCAYRPWIRDSRIVPDETALKTATGYSFPSGHSMNGASLFGGMAIRRELTVGLRALLWLLLFFVAFSRNFLGVHTPQDTIVGSVSGVLVMFLTGKLLKWLESHPEKEVMIAATGILIAIVSAIYSAYKPYPVDYDAAGNLLVDGLKMANDTFKAVGWMGAFFAGWLLEKRLVGFTTTGISMQQRFYRLMGGLMGYYVVTLIINSLVKKAVTGFTATVITCFIQMFYIVFVFPYIIKLFNKVK